MPTEIRRIRRVRQAPFVFDPAWRSWLFIHKLQIDAEMGVGTLTGDGENPVATLSVSRDRGQTFGNEIEVPLGRVGAYRTRAIWRRLGRARDWVLRVAVAEPVKVALVDCYVDVEKGHP